LISSLLKQQYKIKQQIGYSQIQKINNSRIYQILIESNLNKIRKDLKLDAIIPDEFIQNPIAKRSFIIGAFLSGGSISSIDKSVYHLEIRSTKIQYLRIAQKILADFNISISILSRRYVYVLYIKRATDISDFLKIIGAKQAMQELEDKIIQRDYYSAIHRLNNLDIANLKKITTASNQQIKMIKAIKSTKLYQQQDKKFKYYCNMRLIYPEASLLEIVKLFKRLHNINITRTGINHYVLKIKKIYKAL
jgi:DNA-binding protein WhiA